jgi:carbamate kinase
MSFEAGSMGPKVSAAAQFAESGGLAVIGNMQDAAAMLKGAAGTRVFA